MSTKFDTRSQEKISALSSEWVLFTLKDAANFG